MDAKLREQRRVVHLSDYCPSSFTVTDIDLRFDLFDEACNARATLHIERQNNPLDGSALRLDGENLELISVVLQGERLTPDRYQVLADALVIPLVPNSFDLSIETRLYPQRNTALTGLYLSSGNFCTQCEPEGFRRMMYMIDRPDVLARYTTTLVADKTRFPALLSNGNCIERGDAGNGRHFATWQDPFPKPSYLFALVAGNLAYIEDRFTTCRGRDVVLRIYVEPHNVDRCEHAMMSLKYAMRWDEEMYGREYDLDIYMIVAVDDFNMGAMENKGLNIFNSKYVLARPDTATDADYQSIEAIVGHEYFHNWSGNRVTCRDWFQLSLKEGFTVFRDQEFTSDRHSRAVKRIHDVNILRTQQFREDASPMAHPVRPSSYMEINNFYTVTVYNKGAELIRMMHQLLGPERFRAGTDWYFACYDGKAVTTDDFVAALEQASGVQLDQFKRWYSQSGTPELRIEGRYDSAACRFDVCVRQTCAPTPGQNAKLPFHMPLAVALLDRRGKKMPLRLEGDNGPAETTKVLSVHDEIQTFSFVDVRDKPIPSYLRGFSAPVKLVTNLAEQDLVFLAIHDDDPFNRWDANQRVQIAAILQTMQELQTGQPTQEPAEGHSDIPSPARGRGWPAGPGEGETASFGTQTSLHRSRRSLSAGSHLDSVYREHLNDSAIDPMFASSLLSLPGEHYISEFVDIIDPIAIHQACRRIRQALAVRLESEFRKAYEANIDHGDYRTDSQAMSRRSLKNTCLGYLMELDNADIRNRCITQFSTANNMTDVIAALTFLVNTPGEERQAALDTFYQRWQHDPLVIDKWFTIQASSSMPDTVARVRLLRQHPAFTMRNPNRVRAVLGAFAHNNPAQFHDARGTGYQLVTDSILELDALNPQVAARLTSAFALWRRFDTVRQTAMCAQLQRISAAANLSRDTYEVVATILGATLS